MSDNIEVIKQKDSASSRNQEQDQYMSMIQIAVEKQVDISYLQKLMDLQDRHEEKQAKKAFYRAMSEFQSIVPIIEKNGVVDFTSAKGRTNYSYAKLEDISQAIKPALVKTGLSFRHTQSQKEGLINVVCTITHLDGHSETNQLFSTPDTSGGKDGLKSLASTISYLKRYTLTGGFGLVVGGEDTEDFGGSFGGEKVTNADVINTFPDEKFNKVFPAWEKAILVGKKTNQQIVEAGNKQGITFSNEQLNSIYNVGQK